MAAFLTRIRDNAHTLRRSERRVAEVVLAMPRKVMGMSISQLAERAEVSEPTVMRFTQQLGLKGYREFSLNLAQELGPRAPSVRTDVEAGDDVATIGAKICASSSAALAQFQDQADWKAIERIVDALAGVERFEFYGVGASGLVAQDAQQKFFRLGKAANAYNDPHQQIMSASVADARTGILAFSYTGRSRETVEAAALATRSGAEVVAVTAAPSPLAEGSRHLLALPRFEDTFLYTPMASRLVQLAVVDILVTSLALRCGDELTDRLSRIKDSLNTVRPGPTAPNKSKDDDTWEATS
ncbi:SIS domain-containing protein [Ferruginivarius sediminum]|nr:SIS domain-containing protein [Ferruginivarius sediminum]